MPVCFCTGNSTLSRNVTNRKYYKKYRKPRRRATARREPRCSYTATIGTAFHIQHRSIQTKVDKVTPTTIEALTPISAQRPTSNTEAYRNKPTRSHIPTTKKFSKKARGVCRGAVALRPLCGFPQLLKARKPCLLPRKAKHTSHRHNVKHPTPKNTKTSQHGHTSPQPRNFQKKARGVCRGAVALRPLCGFP